MVTNVCSKRYTFELIHSGRKLLLCAALACMLWVAPMLAQNSTTQTAGADSSVPKSEPSSKLPPEPPRPDWLPKGAVWEGTGWSIPEPLSSQYESFFAWTIHLDEQAELHEKSGKDGSWLRNHLEESIGLTPAEVDLVREAARRNQEETKEFNNKIVAVIMANRAKYPKNVEPPLPQESSELEKQRDEATMHVVSDLEEKLGPTATTKLENWREKHWAGSRTVEQGPLPEGAEKAWQELNQKRYQETKKQHEQQNQSQQQKQQQQNGQEVHQ